MRFYPLIGIMIISGLLFRLGDIGSPRCSYDRGSCGKLEGRQVIVSMFVNTEEYKWEEEDKEETLRKLSLATAYLENEARKNGREVEFIYDWKEEKGLDYKGKVKFNIKDDEIFIDSLDKKLSLWLQYLIDYDKIKEEYSSDGVFMMVFFNTDGRSYAINYDGLDNPDETVIMYAGSAPSVYAHEILHLYGARDMYEGEQFTDETVAFLKKKYPDEIMLNTEAGDKITKKISPLTAYYIGWKDEAEDIDDYPELSRYEK